MIRLLAAILLANIVVGLAFDGLRKAHAIASPWYQGHGANIRLVSTGETTDDGALLAGIEFDLVDGWKTYWRNPGEAGIPPQFDFSASTGVKDLKVYFPAPKRFNDGTSNSIVYKSDVILPVKIWPSGDGTVVDLKLTLFAGLCEQICVPVTANLELAIPAVRLIDRPVLEAVQSALAELPRPTQDDVLKVGLAGIERDDGRRFAKIVVDGVLSADVDLFAEALSGDFVPVPERISTGARSATFLVDITDIDGGDARLRLTVVDRSGAIETEVAIDGQN